jgi:hypothetical protein
MGATDSEPGIGEYSCRRLVVPLFPVRYVRTTLRAYTAVAQVVRGLSNHFFFLLAIGAGYYSMFVTDTDFVPGCGESSCRRRLVVPYHISSILELYLVHVRLTLRVVRGGSNHFEVLTFSSNIAGFLGLFRAIDRLIDRDPPPPSRMAS